MAQIYNSDLTKELINAAKIQISRDNVPNQIADKVVPVMEVNPKLLYNEVVLARAESSVTSVSAQTILTAETNNDIIITGIRYQITKDAACDVATAVKNIIIQVGGSQVLYPISFNIITLTAQHLEGVVRFEKGIKIDRNSNIATNSFTYTAGVAIRNYQVYGYRINNPNA